MRTISGIAYGDHIGPCRHADIGAGELAVEVRPGSPYSLPAHVVGTAEELSAAGHDLTSIDDVIDGRRPPSGAPHLCECRAREHGRVRTLRREQVRDYVAGRAPIPERVMDGGYDCFLAAQRARKVALSEESHALADRMLAGD